MRHIVTVKRIGSFGKKHPFFLCVLASLAAGILIALVSCGGYLISSGFLFRSSIPSGERIRQGFGMMLSSPVYGAGIGIFLCFPVILTIAECVMFVRAWKRLENRAGWFDLSAMVLGAFFSYLYLMISEVRFDADWDVVLVNSEVHTPVYTGAWLTVAVIALIAFAGYWVVHFIPLKKMPPLLLVLGLSAMYLGALETVVWMVQIFGKKPSFFLFLFPFNCVLLTARTVLEKMHEWREIPHPAGKIDRVPLLGALNRFLERSERWSAAAFLLMCPLLGILIGILALFGQAPDAVIKAWTETGGWNLSRRVSPQNIYYDEHYLCTVAAGGHSSIVKPLRLGVRHGHEVIVNRQLCIANAFEQVLEERTPRFHRLVRGFYDRYGFPVARLIRSRYAADVIYWLMKPLEWVFLIVLYLVDVNPENRIVIQYTGKNLRDFDTDIPMAQ